MHHAIEIDAQSAFHVGNGELPNGLVSAGNTRIINYDIHLTKGAHHVFSEAKHSLPIRHVKGGT